MTRENTINKFHKALEDLQYQCNMGGFVNCDEFTRSHKITKAFVTQAVNKGIVKRIDRGMYSWACGAPSKRMANMLAEHINEQVNGQKNQTKSIQKTRKRKPQKSVEEVSWFWGLYTKTITK
jgi:hypothetical protein